MKRSSKETALCYPLSQLHQGVFRETVQQHSEVFNEEFAAEINNSTEKHLISRLKRHNR